MQLLRTCAAWLPDTVGFRDPVVATRIALKALARRILEPNDEVAALDELIDPLVTELAPQLLAATGVGVEIAGQAVGHRRRQPQAAAQRGGLCDAVRRGAAARLLRAHPTPPAQPRW